MQITLRAQKSEKGPGYRNTNFSTKCRFYQKGEVVHIYSADERTLLGVTDEPMEEIKRKIRVAENDDVVNRVVLILSERFDDIEARQQEILENQKKIMEMLSKKA